MHKRAIQFSFFLSLLIGTLVVVFFLVKPFIAPLVLAFMLGVVFYPMYRKIRNAVHRPSLASALSLLIILLVVLLPLAFFSWQVFNEARDFYVNNLSTNGSGAWEERLRGIAGFLGLSDNAFVQEQLTSLGTNLNSYVQEGVYWLVSHAGSVFSEIAAALFDLFICFIALFYIFRDGSRFKAKLVAVSPLSDQYDETIIHKLENTVSSVFRGVIVVAIVQALLSGIGFAIFGVPNPALWGSLAVMAALVPGIGTALVMVPGVLYLMFTGSVGAGVGLAVWAALAVGLVDNFLSPYLMNRRIKIHSFLILISVLGGLVVFGPIGFVMGPMVLSLLSSLFEMYPAMVLKETQHGEQS